MNGNIEEIINGILERIGRGYRRAKEEWQNDRRNTFKDGRFLAYYECVTDLLTCEDVACIREALCRRFEQAKSEWQNDRGNRFKDGRLLACFEMLNMVPEA